VREFDSAQTRCTPELQLPLNAGILSDIKESTEPAMAEEPPPRSTSPPPTPVESGPVPASPAAHAHHGLPQFRFLEELKRRNVGRVAILYLVIGYLILEVFGVFVHLLELPAWVGRSVVLLMAIGFPIALLLAWIYEITPEGLKPTEEVAPHKSIRRETGKRLDRAIIAALSVALAYFVIDKFWLSRHAGVSAGGAVTAQSDERRAQPAPVPVASAVAISDKSVAVLPFLDMSEKQDQEYFSDGLSEELIDMLVKIPDLRVPARTSSFYFKKRSEDIPTIARRLLVAHILEGSVRKSGNHLRITAQLVRADNGYHLWSETYDRKVDDIFKVQDEIATAVAAALKLTLSGNALPRTTGTSNVEAYNLYLQARAVQRHDDSQDGTEHALGYLRQALTADPRYAAAWARRSMLLGDLNFHLTRTPAGAEAANDPQGATRRTAAASALAQAHDAVKEALKLDPNLPEAHLAAARLLLGWDGNRVAAEEEVHKAVSLDPKDPLALAFAARLAAQRGDFDWALAAAMRAIAVDPTDPAKYDALAEIYYHAGNYSEALATVRKEWELAPGLVGKHWSISQILFAKGQVAAGLAELDLDPDSRSAYCLGCGFRVMMYDALGRKAEAEVALSRLKREHPDDGAYEFARIHAERGQLDLAFQRFEQAISLHDDSVQWLKFDPLLKNAQRDPRFRLLLRKVGLPE
jgi:adenylate cyclase